MAKIIYEPHPVNPARKAKLQAQGYKIIDAIFAPAGIPIHQELDDEPAPVEAELEVAAEPVVEAEAEEDTLVAYEEAVADAPVKRSRSKKG